MFKPCYYVASIQMRDKNEFYNYIMGWIWSEWLLPFRVEGLESEKTPPRHDWLPKPQHECSDFFVPVKLRSVIRKLSGQNDLDETILAPSFRSAKRSFSIWSTFGPKAKLFTNTMVAPIIFSRCSSCKKSPLIRWYSPYFFPYQRIHLRKWTLMLWKQTNKQNKQN